jgi:lysosomal alpha-mannosidase
VASLWDGEMEILIHRRLLKDDNRGVGEPLNETQSISPYDWKDDDDVVHREPVRIGKGLVVRGTHTISLTTPAQAAREYRRLQDELYYSPVLGFSAGMSFGSDQDFRSGLAAKLPKNVAILTVEMQPSGSVLVLPLDSIPPFSFPPLAPLAPAPLSPNDSVGSRATWVLSFVCPGF